MAIDIDPEPEPVPAGQLRPGARRARRRRPGGDRPRSPRRCRAPTCATGQPGLRPARPLPPVRRRRHDPRRHARRAGGRRYRNRWVREPRACRPSAGPAARSSAASPSSRFPDAVGDRRGRDHEEHGQHQRDPPRRPHPRPDGGRAAPPSSTAELETVGEYDFDGALQGSMTAHPKGDPATGELLFFGYSPFPPLPALPRGRRRRRADPQRRHRPARAR